MAQQPTIVIGGSLLGITSAYELVARGGAIVLLEALDGVALETRFANGALLTPIWQKPYVAFLKYG